VSVTYAFINKPLTDFSVSAGWEYWKKLELVREVSESKISTRRTASL